MTSKISLVAAMALVALLAGPAPALAHVNDSADVNRDLMMATARGDLWRVKWLVENGANVNWRDEEGYTPMIWAAQHGHAPIVEYLTSRFASVNPTDRAGYTPLMWAAQEGHVATVEALLKKGANPNVNDKRGANAMTLARWSGNDRVYAILREAMGRASATDSRYNLGMEPGQAMMPATNWGGAVPNMGMVPQWTAPAPPPRPVAMYEPVTVNPPIYDKYQAYPLNKDHQAMLARKTWAISRMADESNRFRADYSSYVQATASQLGWDAMGTLNDPDLEVGKYMNAMYATLLKNRDLARARRDLGRAKNIQDARGETLFSRYIVESDKILRDAGW
jgi:hypothetical protein